jgi:hypothetical protein
MYTALESFLGLTAGSIAIAEGCAGDLPGLDSGKELLPGNGSRFGSHLRRGQ